MDFKNLIMSIGIGIVCIIAVLGLVGSWNVAYGDNVSAGFNSTMAKMNMINNVTTLSINAGKDVSSTENNQSIAGSSSTDNDLVRQGLQSLKKIPEYLGLAEVMISEGSTMLNIDDSYSGLVQLAIAMLIIAFVITFMYVLILGVKKL